MKIKEISLKWKCISNISKFQINSFLKNTLKTNYLNPLMKNIER